MNREDIIRMGHEAWLCDANGDDDNSIDISLHLERFAKLVVANIDPKSSMSWQDGYEAGVVAEREACAKVCDANYTGRYADLSDICAKDIRARGKE